jgi:hypothetical protein
VTVHADRWGVDFEICFDNEERWDAFRSLPAVRAALDAVPDPFGGLLIYPGCGLDLDPAGFPAGGVVNNGLMISFGREDLEEAYQVLTENIGPRGQGTVDVRRP